jgi:replicative superfamily II helicase
MKPTISPYLENLAFAPGEFEEAEKNYDELFIKVSDLLEQSINDVAKNKIKKLVLQMSPDISEYKLEQVIKEETQSMAAEFTAKALSKWFEEVNKIE